MFIWVAGTAQAQPSTEFPALIRQSIDRIADSLFLAHGEAWSKQIWSAAPDFRRASESTVASNGLILEELRLEEQGISVDPAGRELAMVRMYVSGSLLLREGKVIPFEVERALNVLHDHQMPLRERYPELLRKDSSLWTNVFQPALVALGAAAIIALFFFVRS